MFPISSVDPQRSGSLDLLKFREWLRRFVIAAPRCCHAFFRGQFTPLRAASAQFRGLRARWMGRFHRPKNIELTKELFPRHFVSEEEGQPLE